MTNPDATIKVWKELLQRSPVLTPAPSTHNEHKLAAGVRDEPILPVKAPAASTWVWSDLHLGARGVGFAKRQWSEVHARERTILAAWDERVRSTDTIICLGDVAEPSAIRDARLVARLRECPGRRVLVIGNHDLLLLKELEEAGFREQTFAALCATDPPVALTHAPLAQIPPGCVHLHGHLHGRGVAAPRRRDVSVDVIGLAPRRLDEILEDLAKDGS
ncbi:MAG: metallophosphoesterase family protein [Acidobacteria bacterium]|nr:metallophosphoesterase family protein [Acidobacteriota bacterium]